MQSSITFTRKQTDMKVWRVYNLDFGAEFCVLFTSKDKVNRYINRQDYPAWYFSEKVKIN